MNIFKKNIILLGDGAVGKTSLVRRFVTDDFSDKYLTTIGTKATKKEVFFGSGDDLTKVVLIVWDVLGQKGYKYTQALSFGGIEGALMVCDITRKDTLTSLEEYWVPSLKSVTGPLPMVFLGNKSDLNDEAEFGETELRNFASNHNPFTLQRQHIMTSAKVGTGVNLAFDILAEAVLNEARRAKDLTSSELSMNSFDATNIQDVTEHIISDFSSQLGGLKNAWSIVENLLKKVGLDREHPEKKKLVELVNALAGAEEPLIPPERVSLNRAKRLYLINKL